MDKESVFAQAKKVKTNQGIALLFSNLKNPNDIENEYLALVRKGIVVLLSKELLSEKIKQGGNYLDFARKLIKINRSERTEDKLKKVLSETELETLKEMERKGLVKRVKMNNETFISLEKGLFAKARALEETAVEQSSQSSKSFNLRELFLAKGYIILENEDDIQEFSKAVEDMALKGLAFGFRDFDRKLYFIRKEDYEKHLNEIYKLLEKEEMGFEEIAKCLGIENDLAKTMIVIMKEKEGDIIESVKGRYKKV